MILECKSCQKKFIVPDNAISSDGRLVQCSACGNKWTQYPISNKSKKIAEPKKKRTSYPIDKKIFQKKSISKPKKTGPSIYSREYLEKKHGIKIKDMTNKKSAISQNKKSDTSAALGFYSYFLIFVIFIFASVGILNLIRDIIIDRYPFSETYINYFYENLNNFLIFFKDMFNTY